MVTQLLSSSTGTQHYNKDSRLIRLVKSMLATFKRVSLSYSENHLSAEGKLSRMSDKKDTDYLITNGEEPIKVSYIFPNGDRYEGECSMGAAGAMMRSGTGKHTSTGGVIYTGEWHEDKMHGRGTLQHPTGAIYEGEFKDNMYEGTGTYTFPDGSMYKGQFHKNRLEGEGAFTDTRGLAWTGEFHGKAALGLKMQYNLYTKQT